MDDPHHILQCAHLLSSWKLLKRTPDYPREESHCLKCGKRFERYVHD